MTALGARSSRHDVTFIVAMGISSMISYGIVKTRAGDAVMSLIAPRGEFRVRARATRPRLLLLDADRFGCIEIVMRGRDGEKKRERKRETHHCCGRAATAGFATSCPIASTGADNRTPLTRA